MRQNKALRYLGFSLITLALLTLIIWAINLSALPILPKKINQAVLLSITIILGLAALVASLNDIVDLLQKLFGGEAVHVKGSELLKVTVEKAVIKYIQTGNYWMQINLRFNAPRRDIYLKTIRLKVSQGISWSNPDDTHFGKNGLPINFLMPYQGEDILNLKSDQFYEYVKTLEPDSLKVRDLLIKSGSYLSTTLVGDLHSERLPDSWEDLPLTNWHFLIEYGDDEQADCQFSFSIHPSSPKRAIKFEHYGFQR